jgi:hypothetical protein
MKGWIWSKPALPSWPNHHRLTRYQRRPVIRAALFCVDFVFTLGVFGAAITFKKVRHKHRLSVSLK